MAAVPAILANSGTYRPGAINPASGGGLFAEIFTAAQNLDQAAAGQSQSRQPQYSSMATQPLPASPSAIDDKLSLEAGREESALNPLLSFFQQLQKQNLGAGSLVLDPENKARLEELMLNSGYSSQEIEQLLQLAKQEDGGINLLALGQAVLMYPPVGGQAFILNQTDRPLFAQAMQDLGIPSDEIENYLNSAPRQGNDYQLRDIASLLTGARIDPARGEEGLVDQSRLQDLLQKLGLNKSEADLILNNSNEQGANAREMFALLQSAAQKQDQGVGQALQDLAQRSQQNQTPESDAQRLQAQMIKLQQKMEAKTAQRDNLETGQAAEQKQVPLTAKAGVDEAAADNNLSQSEKQALESAAKILRADMERQKGFHEESSPHAKEQADQAKLAAQGARDAAGQSKTGGQENLLNTVLTGNSGNSGAAAAGASVNVLPAYLVRQVAFNMVQMVNRGENTLRMELKPPTMGEISMELTSKDGAVKASLVAQTVAARKALEAGMEQLKQQLIQQGLRVEQLEISVQPDAQKQHERAEANGERRGHKQRGQQSETAESGEIASAFSHKSSALSVMA